MRAFVTGTAGFIGSCVAARLLDAGHEVLGLDGLTEYYDVRLKRVRQHRLEQSGRFRPLFGQLENAVLIQHAVQSFRPELVLHFAAQAGVRYSIEHPASYIDSNLIGTFNLLEALRAAPPRHLLFASTSSVYGANPSLPFREIDRTDFPASIYAATKRGGESLTHSYAHLFGIPTTVLRLFTVYGPWGRPDMAAIRFASAITRGTPIDVYGNGTLVRDYTFIDDVVAAVFALSELPPTASVGPEDSLSPVAPWRVVNVAGGMPVILNDFIAAIEAALGQKARKRFLPLQPGDVTATAAGTTLLRRLVGSVPETRLEAGIAPFVDWYRQHGAQFDL